MIVRFRPLIRGLIGQLRKRLRGTGGRILCEGVASGRSYSFWSFGNRERSGPSGDVDGPDLEWALEEHLG